ISAGSALVQETLANLSPTPPDWIARLPLVGGQLAALWQRLRGAEGDIGTLIAPYSRPLATLLVNLGQAAVESVLQILLALIVATVFWTSGDTMAAQLRAIARRLGGAAAVASIDMAGGAVRGVAWGVVGTALLQAVLMGIGLAIAGVPGAAMLGFLTL